MSTKTQNKNITPLFGNVLIKPLDSETKTVSGIILPESAQKESQVGTVMAVGEGWHNHEGKVFPLKVKVGQKVMYKKWGTNEVKVGNEDWTIVEEKDILAIVE
jgi:chaperonin GroES